ncbi:TetR/AcrR family transcriptional regulator [Streptomyces sp. NPDC001389]|uniref:TetR/AcrR family transcriptional regulator n=1 Tax=unclassified Streptomyces TaxID=2593676 RepID=UPI0036874AF4
MAQRRDGTAGGPRRRAEIFSATLGMLGEAGFDSLTVEGVARRAGVNKTTLYRWWPSKSELLHDALLDSDAFRFDPPDTGSLRGDLAALADRIRHLLDDEHRRTVVEAVLVGAVRHPAMRELVVSFLDDRFGRHRPLFARAVARGELPPDADPAPLVDALAGALWMRILVRRDGASDGYPRELAGLLMDGAAHSAASAEPGGKPGPGAGT